METQEGWSTRQLAEIAGTTIKTVRHYHRMGVLDLPERAANGYKQYRTSHLARVLQVKRLTEFGLSLAQIRAMGEAAGESEGAFDALEAELASTIERLQRIREELANLREHRAPLDVPAPFASVAEGLSERDRALLAVFSGTLKAEALEDLRLLMAAPQEVDDDFEHLPADATDAVIEEIADRLAESIRHSHARFPWMADPASAGTRGRELAKAAIGPAIVERLNRAQLKALVAAMRKYDAQD